MRDPRALRATVSISNLQKRLFTCSFGDKSHQKAVYNVARVYDKSDGV